jgi:hypothetical protein
MPSTGMMEKVDSLIQRAQHLACIRRPPLDFTGASRADVIEMIREEIIESMKGGTLSPSCKTCQRYLFSAAGARTELHLQQIRGRGLALAGKPSSRILASLIQQAKGSSPRFENVFIAPSNMILFDITTTEMKLAESEAVKCKLCPFLWPVDAGEGEYLAARRTWDGAWQFGLGAMTDVKNDNGGKLALHFPLTRQHLGCKSFLLLLTMGKSLPPLGLRADAYPA